VGNDDRDRQGPKSYEPESPWARSEDRSPPPPPNTNTGSGPRPNKAGPGSAVDTGNRTGRGEDRLGRPTRSGSKSNAGAKK
jgi:hypothetical protein